MTDPGSISLIQLDHLLSTWLFVVFGPLVDS